MEIYLIRHTETVASKGICYGQTDVALNEPYDEAFSSIVGQLSVTNPILYSSPSHRCAFLAKYIHSKIDIQTPLVFDHRLKELDFGQWEMMSWDDIPQEPLKIWADDFVNEIVPGGESFQQLHDRVGSFISEFLSNRSALTPIIIVAHAGVVRSFLCHFRNIELKDAFDVKVDFGQVFKLQLIY